MWRDGGSCMSVDRLVVCHADVRVVLGPKLFLDVGTCHTYRVSAEQPAVVEHHPVEDVIGFEPERLTDLMPPGERIRNLEERSDEDPSGLVVLNRRQPQVEQDVFTAAR